MTKKLSELLDLAPSVATVEESQQFIVSNQEIIKEVDVAISKIDAALPLVRDLEAGDRELDELADMARDKAQDMLDLGLNTDPRFAGVILQTASNMLGHAITAKTAKMDKKLRMIQLQLQKARLDHMISKDADDGGNTPVEGQGVILNRNDLLAQILNRSNEQKK